MNVFASSVFAAFVFASNVLHGGSATSRARGGDGGSDDAKIHRRRSITDKTRENLSRAAEQDRLDRERRNRIEEEEFVIAMMAAMDD